MAIIKVSTGTNIKLYIRCLGLTGKDGKDVGTHLTHTPLKMDILSLAG